MLKGPAADAHWPNASAPDSPPHREPDGSRRRVGDGGLGGISDEVSPACRRRCGLGRSARPAGAISSLSSRSVADGAVSESLLALRVWRPGRPEPAGRVRISGDKWYREPGPA